MPKQKTAKAAKARAAHPTPTSVKTPVEAVRDCADALFRAAEECCYQHDRISRILGKAPVEAELESAQKVCELCDKSLRSLSEAYETASAQVRPTGADEAWWKCANAVWLASKEFLRRHRGCDVSTRQLKEHGPGKLGELHTEYELEASALLGLRHAAEAYRRARPAAA